MTDKEIIEDINYRIRKNDIIKKLEEDVTEGVYDDNPLIDLVLYYKRDIGQLEEENERLYNSIKDLRDYEEVNGEISLTQELIVDGKVYHDINHIFRIKNVITIMSYDNKFLVIYTFNDNSYRYYKRVENK